MSSDKNISDLGEFLKALQQPIRREILNKLNQHENPVSFSKLQKEVLGNISNSKNFSFHLKPLKNLALISSKQDGYSITVFGKQILEFLFNMEQILNESQNPIMIRTSKYSKEKFNVNKIEEYLIKEGELENNLAEEIANQVKQRLKNTNIDYLTAPLMREFINAILLENDLEDVRHRLTRLGTPPYEVSKYFKAKDIPPIDFITLLGSDVSEQYLLLNLLPKNFADMYLSGEVMLLHLNQWALRPLSICLSVDNILERLYQSKSILPTEFKNMRDLISLIQKFTDFLKIFRPYFSEDIILFEFNLKYLAYFTNLKNKDLLELYNLIISRLTGYSEYFRDNNPHITLDFSYRNVGDLNREFSSQIQNDCLFLKKLQSKCFQDRKVIPPLILFDYFNYNNSIFNDDIFNEFLSVAPLENIVFYNSIISDLINSAIIRIKNQDRNKNRIILDKILINLNHIAQKANQNDDSFYSLLHEKLNSVFEFFRYKETFVTKKLDQMNEWKYIITEVLGKKLDNWSLDSIKSISFFGLDGAVRHHCGLGLEKIEKSQRFALNILSFLKDLIREKNETDNKNYNLSQPCNIKILNGSKTFRIPHGFENQDPLQIIRSNSNLSLDKKISLFKKFEKILNGGNLFTCKLDSNLVLNRKLIKILFESNLHTFMIDY